MAKSYITKDPFIQLVYETMQGERTLGFSMPGVENAFETGEICDELYAQVFDAERRLEERLGVGEYDEDVECIINCMQSIEHELCYRMFYYGAMFGMPNQITHGENK